MIVHKMNGLPNLDIGAIRMTLITFLGDPLLRINFALIPSQRIAHIATAALPWSFPLKLCREYDGGGAVRHGLLSDCAEISRVLFCKISHQTAL